MPTVSRDALESHLAELARSCADPRAGLFGPGSRVWSISREPAIFLGSGRAALLQLAHPWVAAALADHSTVLDNPIARFHNTFRIVFTMVFGSLAQVLEAARCLHALHERIQGSMPGAIGGWGRGSRYEANEVRALRWVFGTLVESAVVAYEAALPLSGEAREGYYREMKRFAALFGVCGEDLPAGWGEFAAYMRSMEGSDELGVTPGAQAMGQAILTGAGSALHPPGWFRALTAEWLPARFREEFGLPFAERERRAAKRALRWISRVYGALPARLRYVGPYQEACARIEGRRPGPLVQRNTWFWIGTPRLPGGE